MFDQLDNCAAASRLKSFGPFDMRPMFGGFALFKDGVYFGVASQGNLFFRVSERTRPKYEALGATPFVSGGRYTFAHTYSVPQAVIDNETELLKYAQEAWKEACR
ncbi:MAG: TfoX/Sxy family protein [Candidatus Bruticola sp.]